MAMKSLHAEVVDGKLVLPQEAMAMLPAGRKLQVIVDSERQVVAIYANESPVDSVQYKDAVAFLDELNQGMSQEDYLKPVPEGQLRRPREGSNGGAK